MPNVRLVDGIVTIVDNQNRKLEVSSLSVEGYADTAVSWKYDLKVPGHLAVGGKLVPGGNWAHEVTIQIQDISAWAKPWAADAPDVKADLQWTGALSDTGVSGRLEIRKAQVAKNGMSANAWGALTTSQTADGLLIRPDNLSLKTSAAYLPELRLASGTITFAPATHDLKVDQLFVSLFGGSAKLNAGYNLSTYEALTQRGMGETSRLRRTFPTAAGLPSHCANRFPTKSPSRDI